MIAIWKLFWKDGRTAGATPLPTKSSAIVLEKRVKNAPTVTKKKTRFFLTDINCTTWLITSDVAVTSHEGGSITALNFISDLRVFFQNWLSSKQTHAVNLKFADLISWHHIFFREAPVMLPISLERESRWLLLVMQPDFWYNLAL